MPQDPLIYVAKASNWFCRNILFFPKWVCDNDRVTYHHTETPQSVLELTCTFAIHFTSTVAAVTAVDFLVARPLTRYIQRNYKPKYLEIKRSDLREKNESPASPTAAQVDVLKSPSTMVHELQESKQEEEEEATKNATIATKTDTRKISWFLLHSLFNGLITAVSLKEGLTLLSNPVNGVYTPAKWHGTSPSSLFGPISISAFHIQHFLFYSDLLTTEDIIHHLVNAGVVVAVGVYCPFGNMTALSDIVMCGLPGQILYAALWLQKLGFYSRLDYKNLNRKINLLLRCPVQVIVFYMGLVQAFGGHNLAPDVSIFTKIIMVLGNAAHMANAFYYSDQVIGSYYLEEADVRKRARDEKVAAALAQAQQA